MNQSGATNRQLEVQFHITNVKNEGLVPFSLSHCRVAVSVPNSVSGRLHVFPLNALDLKIQNEIKIL